MLDMWTLSNNPDDPELLGIAMLAEDVSIDDDGDDDEGITIVIDVNVDVAGARFVIGMLLEPIVIDIDIPPPM